MRHDAISCTQRAIFIEESRQLTPDQWRACFEDAFFPTLDALFAPRTTGQGTAATGDGPPGAATSPVKAQSAAPVPSEHEAELRMQCFQLLTRTFLHRLQV